ncbi:MAG: hypothetical protein ACPGTU_17550, partial [Myxococcota bacterium]
THTGSDSTLNRVVTRSGSEFRDFGRGSGGTGSWPTFETWIYYSSSSAGRPRHWTTGDIDGDGLTDAIGLQDGMKIFFGANRPIEGEGYLAKADADVDVVPDTPGTGYHSWVTGWAGYRRDVYSSAQAREGIVIADFDSDGYDDVVTLSALAGDVYGSGLVYINPGDTLRLGGTFDIDAEGTIIEAESDEGAGIRQVTLGGDSNHDGVPDLWIIGEDLEGTEEDQVARLFVFTSAIETTVVPFDSSYASWRPPMADFEDGESTVAEDMWLTNPGDIDGDGYEDALIGIEGGRTWLINNVVP